MRRILITGASGFVGRHALRIFRQDFEDAQILGVGRRVWSNLNDGLLYRSLHLEDQKTVFECISEYRPTDILHLAAQSSVLMSEKSGFSVWRDNIGTTYNILNAVDDAKINCNVVFSSSSEVYGRSFSPDRPATEATKPAPVSAYARSKWISESIIINSCDNCPFKPVIARTFNHVGPEQSEHFAIASFALQIARIEAGISDPILHVGNMVTKRDFLDVKDVVKAYSLIVKKAEDISPGTVFNVSSGQPRSIESTIEELQLMLTCRFEICTHPTLSRPSEIPVASGDSSRIKKTIGWQQTIEWSEYLRCILSDAKNRVRQDMNQAHV